MTDEQLRNRNITIAAARKGGAPIRRIARAFRISHTQVRRILDQLRAEVASSTFHREKFSKAAHKPFRPHLTGPETFRVRRAL